jgi:signal transduction histidine kinase
MRIEMGVRRLEAVDPTLWAELRETRDLVRRDMMNLRELMEQVRPVDVDRDRLPGELADLVDRFSRMSGIHARLVWAARSTDLTPRQCPEILRIVQEALANVRRHSRASHVTIRISSDVSDWEMTIEDDGCGFVFAGRRTHDRLREASEGPRMIRERVESLGGSLEIESSQRGSRLEIRLPRIPAAACAP